MLARTVDPETLDSLAADDPTAQRSRRDLRRIHRAMGTRAVVQRALRDITASRRAVTPLRILERLPDRACMTRLAAEPANALSTSSRTNCV